MSSTFNDPAERRSQYTSSAYGRMSSNEYNYVEPQQQKIADRNENSQRVEYMLITKRIELNES